MYNPYYSNYNMQPQMVAQPSYPQPQGMLAGKTVDSIDVVRATAAPLDGSTLYFPLTDGSAIVTKQLQLDGTSRVIRYEPVKDDTPAQPSLTTMQKELDELKETVAKMRKDLEPKEEE